jgi:hypothetical protein
MKKLKGIKTKLLQSLSLLNIYMIKTGELPMHSKGEKRENARKRVSCKREHNSTTASLCCFTFLISTS